MSDLGGCNVSAGWRKINAFVKWRKAGLRQKASLRQARATQSGRPDTHELRTQPGFHRAGSELPAELGATASAPSGRGTSSSARLLHWS